MGHGSRADGVAGRSGRAARRAGYRRSAEEFRALGAGDRATRANFWRTRDPNRLTDRALSAAECAMRMCSSRNIRCKPPCGPRARPSGHSGSSCISATAAPVIGTLRGPGEIRHALSATASMHSSPGCRDEAKFARWAEYRAIEALVASCTKRRFQCRRFGQDRDESDRCA